ncbi:hypothetical protein [Mycobacteroides salmoniphilum]|uniref:hypothetical protein n=1 Tax=Mycobacteroides salmoniphilum TaxID=404941 RepID=UPI000992EB55|nr:hypothetical protein [Mycobacteroides salmoniphilum]
MDARNTDAGVMPDLAAVAEAVASTIRTGDRGKGEFLAYLNQALPYSDIWCLPLRHRDDD